VTDEELDRWEADERAKPSPDERVLKLTAEVKRLRAALTDFLADGERLVALFAKLTKASGEQALEEIGRRQAALAVKQN
jgi:hypothetical protein